MTIYTYPARSEWSTIIQRPTFDNSQLRDTVSALLDQIRTGGDAVVRELEARFDHCELTDLRISEAEFDEAAAAISPELAVAIRTAARNIARFHESQHGAYHKVETIPGVFCCKRLSLSTESASISQEALLRSSALC